MADASRSTADMDATQDAVAACAAIAVLAWGVTACSRGVLAVLGAVDTGSPGLDMDGIRSRLARHRHGRHLATAWHLAQAARLAWDPVGPLLDVAAMASCSRPGAGDAMLQDALGMLVATGDLATYQAGAPSRPHWRIAHRGPGLVACVGEELQRLRARVSPRDAPAP